jgi:hypothetical protein
VAGEAGGKQRVADLDPPSAGRLGDLPHQDLRRLLALATRPLDDLGQFRGESAGPGFEHDHLAASLQQSIDQGVVEGMGHAQTHQRNRTGETQIREHVGGGAKRVASHQQTERFAFAGTRHRPCDVEFEATGQSEEVGGIAPPRNSRHATAGDRRIETIDDPIGTGLEGVEGAKQTDVGDDRGGTSVESARANRRLHRISEALEIVRLETGKTRRRQQHSGRRRRSQLGVVLADDHEAPAPIGSPRHRLHRRHRVEELVVGDVDDRGTTSRGGSGREGDRARRVHHRKAFATVPVEERRRIAGGPSQQAGEGWAGRRHQPDHRDLALEDALQDRVAGGVQMTTVRRREGQVAKVPLGSVRHACILSEGTPGGVRARLTSGRRAPPRSPRPRRPDRGPPHVDPPPRARGRRHSRPRCPALRRRSSRDR